MKAEKGGFNLFQSRHMLIFFPVLYKKTALVTKINTKEYVERLTMRLQQFKNLFQSH